MSTLTHTRPTVALFVAAALAVLLALAAFAAESPVQFVEIRIAGPEARVLIEMPVQLFQYLAEHSKGDMDVGSVSGKSLKFPMADLVKVVQGDKARDHEILFFTGKDEKGQTQEFYVKTFIRKGAGGTSKPSSLVFTVKEGGKEKVSLKISVDTVESFAKNFGSEDKEKADSEDFGPFVRACLASAKELGPGLVLRIQGKDGELLFSLE